MESKDGVSPTFSLKNTMRAGLALDTPTYTEQSRKDS